MNNSRKRTKQIARAAVIAALYVALGYTIQFMGFGPVQFRLPEALTLLPILMPEAIIGVTLGAFIFNFLSPFWWIDIWLGTLATLFAAIATYLLRKKHIAIAAVPPILFNAFLIPIMFLMVDLIEIAYWPGVGFVALGQLAMVAVIGIPLTLALKKYPHLYMEPNLPNGKDFEESV